MTDSLDTVDRLAKRYRTPEFEAFLRDLYRYDPQTGQIHARRKVRNSHYAAGEAIHGYLNGGGYLAVCPVQGLHLRVHLLAWFLKTGSWPERQVNHRNGKRRDNRWANLRLASTSQRRFNATKPNARNTSGCKGVGWMKRSKVWRARITVNRKEIALGCFPTLSAAKRARRAAERKYFGEFVRRS